jgi:hypothetical protein
LYLTASATYAQVKHVHFHIYRVLLNLGTVRISGS